MRSTLLALLSTLLMTACGGRGAPPEDAAPRMTEAQLERLLAAIEELQGQMRRIEAERWGSGTRDGSSDGALPEADWDALGAEERSRLAGLLAQLGVGQLSDTERFVLHGLLARVLRRLPGESDADYEARTQRWVMERVARLRRVFGAAPRDDAQDAGPAADTPGAGAWCGTPGGPGGFGGLGSPQDWQGPDADGLWWRWRPGGAVRVLVLEDGRTPAPEELRAYGMEVGGSFRTSDPGETREVFLARMRMLRAKLEADARRRPEK